MMSSRYVVQRPMARARLKRFVALDNLNAQVPLIEVIHERKQAYAKIWTAYDYERVCGTYVAVYATGLVTNVTVYPGRRTVEKIVRPADRKQKL